MTITAKLVCRKVPTGNGRVLLFEHDRDCNLSGCEGCAPCPEDHCIRCRSEHLDDTRPRTCASCVGKVRQNILTIGDLITEAHDQQVHRAVGSIAFMLASPAANYEAGMYVHQSAMSGRLCRCRQRGLPQCVGDMPAVHGPRHQGPCRDASCYAVRRRDQGCPDTAFILEELREDEMHPFTVFGAWELYWRSLLDQEQPLDDRTTWTSAKYLLEHLTAMAQADPDESDFAQLDREIATSRRWLEDVLRLGDKAYRGVKCPVCGDADLLKVYDTADEGTAEEPDDARLRKMLNGGYNDLWVCQNPACAQTWTEDEYRDKVHGIYVQRADRLTASQLKETYRVPEGTIRRWANGWTTQAGERRAPVVRKRGRDPLGRQLYDVADVVRQRDATTDVAAS